MKSIENYSINNNYIFTPVIYYRFSIKHSEITKLFINSCKTILATIFNEDKLTFGNGHIENMIIQKLCKIDKFGIYSNVLENYIRICQVQQNKNINEEINNTNNIYGNERWDIYENINTKCVVWKEIFSILEVIVKLKSIIFDKAI